MNIDLLFFIGDNFFLIIRVFVSAYYAIRRMSLYMEEDLDPELVHFISRAYWVRYLAINWILIRFSYAVYTQKDTSSFTIASGLTRNYLLLISYVFDPMSGDMEWMIFMILFMTHILFIMMSAIGSLEVQDWNASNKTSLWSYIKSRRCDQLFFALFCVPTLYWYTLVGFVRFKKIRTQTPDEPIND